MNTVKKIIFCCSFLSMGSMGLQAQSIYFRFTDGSQNEFPVAEIRNITFSQDTMHLNKRNGTTVSWAVNDIGAYKYSSVTGVEQALSNTKENGLTIFPNPSAGNMSISYSLAQAGLVSIDLLGVDGQMIRQLQQEQHQSGDHTMNWDGKDSKGNQLPNGTYLCRVNAAGTISNRKIIILK